MNWDVYNDSLVRRGEILLDFSVLDGWNREVKLMSVGRRGRPFTYPDSLIGLLASIRLLFHLPYRQLEGFTRALSRYVDGLRVPDYTTLDRRVNRLNLKIDESLTGSDETVYTALDSTGVKVHKSGDWIRRRFKVRKGYLKVHIAVNVKTRQIIALEVTRRIRAHTYIVYSNSFSNHSFPRVKYLCFSSLVNVFQIRHCFLILSANSAASRCQTTASPNVRCIIRFSTHRFMVKSFVN